MAFSSEQIEDVKTVLKNTGIMPNIVFEMGGLNSDGEIDTDGRVRSNRFKALKGSKFALETKTINGEMFKFNVYLYDDNYNFVSSRGLSSDNYTLIEDAYVRIVMSRQDSTSGISNLGTIIGQYMDFSEVIFADINAANNIDGTDNGLDDVLKFPQKITSAGAIRGTIFAKELALQKGTILATDNKFGMVTDYVSCITGSTVSVDSQDYEFQVMEYTIKGTPVKYSGVLNYEDTYIISNTGYVRICIRYVDKTLIAHMTILSHIVADITGYADIETMAANVNGAAASLYYRDVDYTMIPTTYYNGVGTDYNNSEFTKTTQYADFISAWQSLINEHSNYATETNLGAASDGQNIYLYDFKPIRITNGYKPIPKVVIIAGQHGGEKSNIYGLYYFIYNLLNNWIRHPVLEYLRNHVELMIIPVLNTYGFDNLTYKNGNGVNLNRNYDSHWELLDDATSEQYGGTEPFSQLETQIVRDLILANNDASLVIDSHTNGGGSAASLETMHYYGICESTDNYYNRMLNVVTHQLSTISAHFNIDYKLDSPDTFTGFLNNAHGTGLLRDWVTDNNIVGTLVEGFNGFPGRASFTGEVYKANEEIIVNYIISALNYLK